MIEEKDLNVTVSAIVKSSVVRRMDEAVEKGHARSRSDYIKKAVEYCLLHEIVWEVEVIE